MKAVSEQLAKTLITLEPLNRMKYFDKILHTYTFQHCLTTGMHNSLFYGRGFAEHQTKIWGH